MRALYLIGFRASGKTTVGRALAAQRNFSFLDLDEEWERREGVSILAYVERAGIEAFRRKEFSLLRSVDEKLQTSAQEGWVVATGGGVVEWPESLALLGASPVPKGYLTAPPEELWARIQHLPERQKIGKIEDFPALRRLWERRLPLYEKIATFRVESRDINESLAQVDSQALWPLERT